MEIKIAGLGNGMLISYTDEEEGTEGEFPITNQQEAYEKLAELMAELEQDVNWETPDKTADLIEELNPEDIL